MRRSSRRRPEAASLVTVQPDGRIVTKFSHLRVVRSHRRRDAPAVFDIEIFEGRLGQYETPDWEPLRALLPRGLCDGFMWMNSVQLDDGTELQAYKHIDTRRYLWLDDEAVAYEHLGRDRFRRMRTLDAVEEVFGAYWLIMDASPADKRALRKAFASASDQDSAGAEHLPPSSPALPLRFVP
jgi:hypothetical protein